MFLLDQRSLKYSAQSANLTAEFGVVCRPNENFEVISNEKSSQYIANVNHATINNLYWRTLTRCTGLIPLFKVCEVIPKLAFDHPGAANGLKDDDYLSRI